MGVLDRPARRRPADFSAGANPLAVATAEGDRQVLSMVAEALEQRRMRLAFQPAVYAADPAIPGFFEGLIRILDAKGRVIPARDFMEVAETRQLGRDIDCAALHLGLQMLQRHPDVRLAVNLSARSIGYRPWLDTLARALAVTPGLGRGLILEINEESAVAAPDVLAPFMEEMRAQGIVFCLDDFGAGLTSVPLLQEFGFEMCKIDGRWVRGLASDPARQAMVRALIGLGAELGMFLVAESVETVEEATFLRDHGVGVLQGYLFSAPVLDPDFDAFRRARGR